MRIPVLGVDPTEVGPIELLRLKYAKVRAWTRQPLVAVSLVAGFVALVLGAWYTGVGWPGIPNWGWVAIFTSGFGIVSAWIVGRRLASEIHDPNLVNLSVLDTYSGDQKLAKVPPETFRDATIVSHEWEGETPVPDDMIVGREQLHEVMINGVRHYEVDQYDPVLNVAITSWQAGRSNNDIRTDHDQIEQIKTELNFEINKVYDLLANETETIRRAVAVQTNKIVRVAQDVELPDGAEIGVHEALNEVFDEQNLSDDLREQSLSDLNDDVEDVEEDADMVDVEVSDP